LWQWKAGDRPDAGNLYPAEAADFGNRASIAATACWNRRSPSLVNVIGG
jgi:hypothetical protein